MESTDTELTLYLWLQRSMIPHIHKTGIIIVDYSRGRRAYISDRFTARLGAYAVFVPRLIMRLEVTGVMLKILWI